MRAYTVHAPPGEADNPERYAFIKDGMSWPALLLMPAWIIWHRLWLTLLGYVIWVLVVAWAGRLAGEGVATVLGALGTLLFALEANNIRRLSLARRGWRDAGSSFGQNLEEAEIRFFGGASRGAGVGSAPSLSPSPQQQAPAPAREEAEARAASVRRERSEASRHDPDAPVFGLFPEPER